MLHWFLAVSAVHIWRPEKLRILTLTKPDFENIRHSQNPRTLMLTVPFAYIYSCLVSTTFVSTQLHQLIKRSDFNQG